MPKWKQHIEKGTSHFATGQLNLFITWVGLKTLKPSHLKRSHSLSIHELIYNEKMKLKLQVVVYC